MDFFLQHPTYILTEDVDQSKIATQVVSFKKNTIPTILQIAKNWWVNPIEFADANKPLVFIGFKDDHVLEARFPAHLEAHEKNFDKDTIMR